MSAELASTAVPLLPAGAVCACACVAPLSAVAGLASAAMLLLAVGSPCPLLLVGRCACDASGVVDAAAGAVCIGSAVAPWLAVPGVE
eukprot:600979-Pelagomonas_calceolata.AAC.1